mmetsp:Transcript_162494/g.520872  ORF Transcript_162494/g.520872 Transcript_162494/m.520872 type:complete len:242 (+) Transcript_162494:493-1218(+)
MYSLGVFPKVAASHLTGLPRTSVATIWRRAKGGLKGSSKYTRPWNKHELSSGICTNWALIAPAGVSAAPPAAPPVPGRAPSHAAHLWAWLRFSRVHAGHSHGSPLRTDATEAPPAPLGAAAGGGAAGAAEGAAGAGAGAKASEEDACVAGAPVACRTVAVSPDFSRLLNGASAGAVHNAGGKPRSSSTSASGRPKACAASWRSWAKEAPSGKLAVWFFPPGPRKRNRNMLTRSGTKRRAQY